MRDIDTGWTVAQQKRLSLFVRCEEFGLEIEPQSIAPFSFAVKENGEIRLIMDKIHIGAFDKNGTLSVRNDFPETYDRYVIRATNALRDITDEIGRLDRAAKRQEIEDQEKDSYLLVPAVAENAGNDMQEDKIINMEIDQIRRGLFGLASLGEISIRDAHETSINFIVNGSYEALVSIHFKKDKIEAYCFKQKYKVSPDFENHLIRGAEYWSEKVNDIEIKKILSNEDNDGLLDIDHFTLQQTRDLSHPKLEYEKSGLTVKMNFENLRYAEVYHNEIYIHSISNHHLFFDPDRALNYGGPLIGGHPLSDEEMKKMQKIIINGYVEAMGIDPKDMEKFSEEHLSKKIEDTDMGYYA